MTGINGLSITIDYRAVLYHVRGVPSSGHAPPPLTLRPAVTVPHERKLSGHFAKLTLVALTAKWYLHAGFRS